MSTPSTTPYELTEDERADLEEALAEAERGEFASDEEVAAMYKRHGLQRPRRVGKGARSRPCSS